LEEAHGVTSALPNCKVLIENENDKDDTHNNTNSYEEFTKYVAVSSHSANQIKQEILRK
jgi:hypothetical protein